MTDFTPDCKSIVSQFAVQGEFLSAEPFGCGHINRTYRIQTTEATYLLQKINTSVFKDPTALMNNISAVTEHLAARGKKTLRIVKTTDGALYCNCEDGAYRLYDFLLDTVAYQSAPHPDAFRRAGYAFGEFQNLLADFDASTLVETIPHFHDTPLRFDAFLDCLEANVCDRADSCREEICFLLEHKDTYDRVTQGLADGSIPLRVTHNDTKLNNVLMDAKTDEVRAVIDLDTVMPGSLLYDFGDAIRFGASTAAEDERDLDLVHFDIDRFRTFAEGYLSALAPSITAEEIALLPYSAYLLTVECGMRFLTDYLSGDTYFAISSPDHNLVRARTQLKLAAEMEQSFDAMADVIDRILGETSVGCAMYTVPSTVKVTRNAPPRQREVQGSMMKNETYTFTVVVEGGGSGVAEGKVVASGALADRVRIYPVRDVVANIETTEKTDDYVFLTDDHMYPDLCEESETFSVAAGEVISLLAVVEGAPCAGEFEIPLSLLVGGETVADCAYAISVVDAELPETDLRVTHWMHYDCICGIHGVEPFSDAFYRVFESYLNAYVGMGCNMLLIPTFSLALDIKFGNERLTTQLVDVTVSDGEYRFDFTRLGTFLDFVTAHGIRYYEFSHLASQWGAAYAPKIMATVDGEMKKIFGWENASDSDEYVAFLQAYLPSLRAFIEARGIRDVSYVHISDEPNETHIDHYTKLYGIIKPLIGDISTFDALSRVEFSERRVIDMPVVGTNHAKDFTAQNRPHFAYYCCSQVNEYTSNRMFFMPGERTRVLGYQLYEDGAKGFLQWGFNYYNNAGTSDLIDPYTDTSAGDHFPSGDSFIVYPDTKSGGVLRSLRYFLVQGAFEDYRALMLLASLTGREFVLDLLDDFGIKSYKVYPHSAYLIKTLRETVNRMIAECL